MTELRNFLTAGACAAACWLYMAFGPPSVIAGAFLFAPLWLSTIVALGLLANLVIGVVKGELCPRRRLSLPRKPVVLQRQSAPLCLSCEAAEAVSTENWAYVDRLRALTWVAFLSDPYEGHRDCWVTTGDEGELARMLRHVTWTAS